MLVTVALGGLTLLLFIALAVGYLDGHARGQAWKRLAAERHRLRLEGRHALNRTEQHGCRCLDRPSHSRPGPAPQVLLNAIAPITGMEHSSDVAHTPKT